MIDPKRIELGLNVATALVVVSVAVALAHLTWRLTGDPGGKTKPVVVTDSTVTSASVDISPIIRVAPFGLATADPASAVASTSALVLRGVVMARPTSASSAWIATSGGPVKSYRIGDDLGGATLSAVEVDHVVISVGGRLETLAFAKPTSGEGVAAILAGIPQSVLGLPQAPASAPSSGASPSVAPAASGSAGSLAIGSAIETARQRIADNPRSLIDSLGATPTAQGYRVGASPSLEMRGAGLLPGDIVEKVNGASVGNVENDRRLFDQAVASGRARVEVLRDGRRLVLTFPLQ